MKRHWLSVTLLCALLVRIPGMFQSLWYDESFTAAIAALPCRMLWQATAGDVHPPLWYALEKLMIVMLGGDSEIVLRLPSLALGVANVWLTWRVANAMGLPGDVARIATVLMAVMPSQIWYSNEARMYQLTEFAGLLAVLGAYQRRWVLYGWGLVLGLWSHNLFCMFAVVLAGVTLWGQDPARGQRLAAPIVATGIACLSYVPWLGYLAGQIGDVANGFWVLPLNLGTPLYALHGVLWASTVPAWAGVHAVFISMLLLIVGMWIVPRNDLLILALGPWWLLTFISAVWSPILIARALMVSSPFLAMLIAYGLVGRWRLGREMAILAIPVLVLALIGYVRGDTGRQDMGGFAEPVRLGSQPGDAVFHGNLASYMLMSYYLPEVDHYVWRQANDLSQSLTRETKDAMGLPEADVAGLHEVGYHRLWLYWSLNPTTSQAEYDYITAILDTFKRSEVTVFQSDRLIDARLYLVDLEKLAYGTH